MRSWLATVRRSRGRPPQTSTSRPSSGLTRMVVEGARTGLEATLDELLARMEPLAIINGPLMAGMDEVGRLFGSGQLIVAEVLVSAEVMQAAVDRLKPHLKATRAHRAARSCSPPCAATSTTSARTSWGSSSARTGTTWSTSAFNAPPTSSLPRGGSAARISSGLSGLLVRSAHQMVATAEDLRVAGVDVPLLVGGAALSASFTRDRIAPAYGATVHYASDAMAGLAIANEFDKGRRDCACRAGLAPARALHSLPARGRGPE